jgi:heme/copper-type cytochrome/quinol oxidase subunit 2
MRSIFKRISILISGVILLAPLAMATPASALFENSKQSACSGLQLNETPADCSARAGGAINSLLSTAINIFSIVIGVIAVVMIIVAGLKYITSSGDPNSTASAKNTLLFAIIGLIIVVLAQVIVRFVLQRTAVPARSMINVTQPIA